VLIRRRNFENGALL